MVRVSKVTIMRGTKRGVMRPYKTIRRNNAVVRKVKRSILKDTEKKYLISAAYAQTISNAGSIFDLSSIEQGAKNNQRIGTRIRFTSLFFKWHSYLADSSNIVCCIIFRWHPNTASDAPSVAELIQITSHPVSSWINREYNSQFRIIYDKTIYMDNVKQIGVNVMTKRFSLKMSKAVYDVGDPPVSSGAGKYYVCFVSDSGTTTHPTVDFQANINFIDL